MSDRRIQDAMIRIGEKLVQERDAFAKDDSARGLVTHLGYDIDDLLKVVSRTMEASAEGRDLDDSAESLAFLAGDIGTFMFLAGLELGREEGRREPRIDNTTQGEQA